MDAQEMPHHVLPAQLITTTKLAHAQLAQHCMRLARAATRMTVAPSARLSSTRTSLLDAWPVTLNVSHVTLTDPDATLTAAPPASQYTRMEAA